MVCISALVLVFDLVSVLILVDFWVLFGCCWLGLVIWFISGCVSSASVVCGLWVWVGCACLWVWVDCFYVVVGLWCLALVGCLGGCRWVLGFLSV